MWTIQHTVRLQCDEVPGKVVDITVTEYMDEWPGLDDWEQKVRDLGFQAMRKMLAGGFLLSTGILNGCCTVGRGCVWCGHGTLHQSVE